MGCNPVAKIRCVIPTPTENLGTNDYVEKDRELQKILDEKQDLRYNLNAKDCKPLKEGKRIRFQNPDTRKKR